MKTLTLAVLAVLVYAASAQFNNGQVPPRLIIPGAIALGPKPTGNRQARVFQSAPQAAQPARIRRPGQQRAGAFKSVASPSPFLQQLDETHKPVNEESEELQDVSTPQPFLSNTQYYSSPSPVHDDISQLLLNASPSPRPIIPTAIPIVTSAPPTSPPEPIRQSQPSRPPPQFSPIPIKFDPQISKFDIPIRQQQPVRLAPLSYRPPRPQHRPEARPQIEEEDEEPIRQNYRQPAPRPHQQQQQQQSVNAPAQRVKPNREKKPVAQVIRKYQEENEDGSITWGFENDDGSFKEETIGVDCVTRGKYGYVDPDGVKREYSYETGIPCDKTKEDEEEKGFIDYEGNKAVLPNGVMIDLAAMGKKSKRPGYQQQQLRY